MLNTIQYIGKRLLMLGVPVLFGISMTNELYAQSRSSSTTRNQSGTAQKPKDNKANKPAQDSNNSDEDFVESVNLSGDSSKDRTGSGEQEGVSVEQNDKGDTPSSPSAPVIKQDPDSLTPAPSGQRTDAASEAHVTTRTSAQTITLSIPAPRGPIIDRNGEIMAETSIAYYLGLRYPNFENADKEKVIEYAREKIKQASQITDSVEEFSDNTLWEHYQNRRWLLLPLTSVIKADVYEKIKGKAENIHGLAWMPIYVRQYPEKTTASHLLGYLGPKDKMPTGPINQRDPLWPEVEGRSGLEKEYNGQLRGTPGFWRLMFDEEGNKILDELQSKPKVGGPLVLTLNLKWQKEAERLLANGKENRRGAMVLIDCWTGEVLVMASTPSFDPNIFSPRISPKDFKDLQQDPSSPLSARAFQARYPPASTFKTVTVAAALKNNIISESTLVDCPAAIAIGNHVFNDWSKRAQGSLNCIQALAKSNNPFMIKMSMAMGAKTLMDTARVFGFGARTGLPIQDNPGLVPSSQYMIRTNRRDFTQGDGANLSIGQGQLLVTPLQLAHFMSAVANGSYLPKLHLVKQIQDDNANVIYAANTSEVQAPLHEYESAFASVRKGMNEVTSSGTGRGAQIKYAKIAGKTGTAQWGPERENKRLAWFAGFMPVEAPRYAFVAVIEGKPHQKIGGSSAAGPIIREFFTNLKDDIKPIVAPAKEDIPLAEAIEETPASIVNGLPRNRLNVPNLPDNLPPTLYSSDVPVQRVPANDSSDEEIPSLVPHPGDPDYIPGLQHQVPRHLRLNEEGKKPSSNNNPLDTVDIPQAQPL